LDGGRKGALFDGGPFSFGVCFFRTGIIFRFGGTWGEKKRGGGRQSGKFTTFDSGFLPTFFPASIGGILPQILDFSSFRIGGGTYPGNSGRTSGGPQNIPHLPGGKKPFWAALRAVGPLPSKKEFLKAVRGCCSIGRCCFSTDYWGEPGATFWGESPEKTGCSRSTIREPELDFFQTRAQSGFTHRGRRGQWKRGGAPCGHHDFCPPFLLGPPSSNKRFGFPVVSEGKKKGGPACTWGGGGTDCGLFPTTLKNRRITVLTLTRLGLFGGGIHERYFRAGTSGTQAGGASIGQDPQGGPCQGACASPGGFRMAFFRILHLTPTAGSVTQFPFSISPGFFHRFPTEPFLGSNLAVFPQARKKLAISPSFFSRAVRGGFVFSRNLPLGPPSFKNNSRLVPRTNPDSGGRQKMLSRI